MREACYLFLFCHEYIENNHYYDFLPTKEGACSVQADADRKSLKRYLEASPDWVAKEKAPRFAVDLDFFEKIAIQKMKLAWHGKSEEELTAYLKQHHPAFYMDAQAAPKSEEGEESIFYTIGYEGISPEEYCNRLLSHKVRLLCDVRKNAYSQKFGFSKAELEAMLTRVGIAYLHMPELGIVSEKRQTLKTQADYDALFEEYERTTLAQEQAALTKLHALLAEHGRIAITCFEAKPGCCHRSSVARHIKQREGFDARVVHL